MIYQISDVAGLFNTKHHFPEELFLVYLDLYEWFGWLVLFKFGNISSIAAVIGRTIPCGSASDVWIMRRWNKWHLLPSSGNLSFQRGPNN